MKSGRALFAWSVLAFLAGGMALGVVIARWAADGGIGTVGMRLSSLAPWFLLVRLGVVASVVGGWPRWTAIAARHWHWPRGRERAVAAWRTRVFAWFAVFELVLVQNAFGRAVHWLAG